MNKVSRALGLMASCLCFASPVFAAQPTAAQATAALEAAMTPGAGQKVLANMVGNFDVKIRVWSAQGGAPLESQAVAINSWVLGERYVQTVFSGFVLGAPFDGFGYMGYDNAGKQYQAAWMDSGSTGITWYTGKLDAAGKSALLKASISDPITGKPAPLELRVAFKDSGHVTEIWGQGMGSKMFKMMELTYTKAKR